MKRDMDLVRAILLAMEEHEHGRAPNVEIEGYTDEEIGYNAYLLDQAGFIVAVDIDSWIGKPRSGSNVHDVGGA